MKRNWTPEPWTWVVGKLPSLDPKKEVDTGFVKIDGHGGGAALATCWGDLIGESGPANAQRIVACVNALAGVAHPEKLPELLRAIQGFRREIGYWLVDDQRNGRFLCAECAEVIPDPDELEGHEDDCWVRVLFGTIDSIGYKPPDEEG